MLMVIPPVDNGEIVPLPRGWILYGFTVKLPESVARSAVLPGGCQMIQEKITAIINKWGEPKSQMEAQAYAHCTILTMEQIGTIMVER